MTTRPDYRKHRRYVCSIQRGGCDRCGISAEHLDVDIERLILHELSTPKVRNALLRKERKNSGSDFNDLAQQIEDLEIRDREAEAMWQAGEIDKKRFLSLIRGISDKRAEVNAAIRRATESEALAAMDLSGDISEAWSALPLDLKRELIALLIDRIVIEPAQRGDNRYDSDRIDIHWIH